jgi:hypothetical protein
MNSHSIQTRISLPLCLAAGLLLIREAENTCSGQPATNLPAEIVAYINAAEVRANEIARQNNFTLSSDVKSFIAESKAGRFEEAQRPYSNIRKTADSTNPGAELRTPIVEIARDIELAINAFAGGDRALVVALGKDYMDALPPGCIYFGGTDPGRGLPTALCHAPGDPFFVISQNPLAAPVYMDYVRRLYGSRIKIPTTNEIDDCYYAYYSDASRRWQHDKQFPEQPKQLDQDETVTQQDGKPQFNGQGATLRLDAFIAKKIFDSNPEREFYLEESYAMEWMKPYLTPAGAIMKINREPVPEITQEAINRDHTFWCNLSRRTVGDFVTYDTSVKDLCDFCEKVYLRHDESGFKGDPKFLRSAYTQKTYAKLRDSIAASIYQARAEVSNGSKASPATKARMLKEAEFAFKQALAFYPASPEPIYHSMILLSSQQRFEEIKMIIHLAQKLDPKNPVYASWLGYLSKLPGNTNPEN